MNRREFLKQTALLAGGVGLLAGAPAIHGAGSPNRKVRVGIIGCNGRGMGHISGFASVPNVEIAYICDVDSRAVTKGIAAVCKHQARAPKGEKDLRRMLEDPEAGRSLDCDAGPLAHAGGGAGLCRRQACVCRETRQP